MSYYFSKIVDDNFDDAIERVTKKDRKSTRMKSSHGYISYDVFCWKKH